MTEVIARRFREVEIILTGPQARDPYLDVEIIVDFVHESWHRTLFTLRTLGAWSVIA